MRKSVKMLLMAAAAVSMITACSGQTTTKESSAALENTSEAPKDTTEAADKEVSNEEAAVWPSTKTVEIYLPFAAGGNSDLCARILGEALGKKTGANFVVVNQTEGNGAVCYNTIAEAPADGSILGWVTPSWFTSYFAGIHDLNPTKDFSVLAGSDLLSPVYLCVPKNSPFDTLDSLVTYCKEHPGELVFGMQLGSASHYYAESCAQSLGVSWNYVENGTDANRITSLMGGITQATVVSGVSALQYVEAGELKALCCVAEPGSATPEALKDIPSLKGAGYENIAVRNCNFLYGPKMDDALCAEINRIFTEVFTDAEVQKRLIEMNQEQTIWKDNIEATETVNQLYESYHAIAENLNILAPGRD
ncbi:tripartite tricarboxylate transporter substrate binding protein [Lachnospiraceae bacterium 45-P1]